MQTNEPIVPAKGVVPIDHLFGDDEEDTNLLRQMAAEAQNYLAEFECCKSIRNFYFGNGVGGIVAVFLYRIEPAGPDIDDWLWVLVGDIPPAYLVIDANTTPSKALETYIELMSEWVKRAKSGKPVSKVIPVSVPPTKENAELLETRLKALQEMILPRFRDAETKRA